MGLIVSDDNDARTADDGQQQHTTDGERQTLDGNWAKIRIVAIVMVMIIIIIIISVEITNINNNCSALLFVLAVFLR